MAYIVLQSPSDLQQLVNRFLEAPPLKRKLSLIGILNNTLLGKISFEALVDRWPDYSTLVLRPVEGAPSSKYFQRYRLVDANDPENMRDFLSIPGVLPWDATFEIRALPSILEDAMKQVIVENGSAISRRHLFYLVHGYSAPKEHIRLAESYYFKPLRPEHAQIIYENWNLGVVEGRETYEFIRYQIETFPSIAAYSEKHELASWLVNMFDGGIGIGGTLPGERKKGLYGSVANVNMQLTGSFGYAAVKNMATGAVVAREAQLEPTADTVLYLKCTPQQITSESKM